MEYPCHKWSWICSTCSTPWSFPLSWLITGFVYRLTRRVPLVEHELLILPGHLRSPPVFSEVRVAQSLILCVCFVDRCLSFCPVLSVLLWFTDSDYPFGIFNLFLQQLLINNRLLVVAVGGQVKRFPAILSSALHSL